MYIAKPPTIRIRTRTPTAIPTHFNTLFIDRPGWGEYSSSVLNSRSFLQKKSLQQAFDVVTIGIVGPAALEHQPAPHAQ